MYVGIEMTRWMESIVIVVLMVSLRYCTICGFILALYLKIHLFIVIQMICMHFEYQKEHVCLYLVRREFEEAYSSSSSSSNRSAPAHFVVVVHTLYIFLYQPAVTNTLAYLFVISCVYTCGICIF